MNQIQVELQEWMGSDRAIAEAAWTSSYDFAKKKIKTDVDVANIVKRLAVDGHATPFESVILRFWIRIPIFVDRQHMTHRIASHNGLSGRYRTMPKDYFDMPDEVHEILENKVGDFSIVENYIQSCEIATNNYSLSMQKIKQAEKDGKITNQEFKRCREILRGQLPTAGMVERTTIMNLRSFCNYQKQRNSIHSQPEIKQVAQQMLQLVKDNQICPTAIESLEKNNWIL